MNQQPRQPVHFRPAYLAALLALAALAPAEQRIGFRRMHEAAFENANFAGAALIPGDRDTRRVVAWGNQVVSIRFPNGKGARISEAFGFGPGGCAMDVNDDGKPDLVLFEKGEAGKAGRMVWLEAPDGRLHVIDTDAGFADCLITELNGKRGVLVIHRQIQVRFYETPANPHERWPYREIYSIYTPSAQGGLLRYDVNGNGRADLLAGNYWLQAPPSPEKPWHIFAINKWWEQPRSAMLRLALVEHQDRRFPSLLAAEAEASPARVALFDRPADPKQLWRESPVEAIPAIRKPEALATADLNADGLTDLIIGENAGEGSRLLVYWGVAKGQYQGTRIDLTEGLIGVWAVDYDGDGDLDLVGVGPSRFYVWRNQELTPAP